MNPPSAAFPLQVAGDVFSTLLDFLPLIVLILVIAGVMMWFLGWMSRYFEYLKTIESEWLDRNTLEFVRRVLEAVWVAFMVIIVLTIAATRSLELHEALETIVARAPAAFVFVFVLFIGAVVVRVLHRFASYLRGELKAKPRQVAPAGPLAFAEIVLKYAIYIVALVVAILGGIRALPAVDQAAIQATIGVVPGIGPDAALGILAGVVAIAISDRFVDSVFEDMKLHSTKFSSRALDELKSVARYGVWVIGAVVLLFIILGLALTGDRLVIFAVGFVTFLIALAFIGFTPIQNALAGFTLMRADPFDVGNRVKFGDELVGDIVSLSLSLTTIRTLRNEIVQFPNAALLRTPIVNFSRSKPYAIFLEVPVPIDVGHERVRDILLRASAETDGVVKDKTPEVFGKEIEGDTIRYELFAFTDQPERMKEIKSALIYRVQDLLSEAGIRPVGRNSSS